ncbi:hypothetical protein COV24_03755 [candidate division WWE3 bacterium CG10_big_fil_rev_8_21_14_0_10_32_10]|uniref:ATPase BadF/BadG/BcrA/BcrD type domain-containing protein n=1 Tax=candidate division WWE3 bacterium CG10_big_fil_rev_8_21_14_0_10_32_10 TaxID=1975090 RepID=A0A2H0R9N4_UNCKA|nr:MAG: hypothetical protein COV24_03755 [candidate division WWE3 bacterium CG10_big_fil_rev_8_21_14_0_10_32_10]
MLNVKNKYLLSIDGGSSTVKAGVINIETGEIQKEISANNPLNYNTIRNKKFNTLRIILTEAGKEHKINSMIMGVSGIDNNIEKRIAIKTINNYLKKNTKYKKIKLVVVNDIDLVIENIDREDNKIAIIAGTGSNCFGVNKKGDTAKSGGLGELLTDQGSGYYIGLEALKETVKSYDGRSKKTELESRVLRYFRIYDVKDLKNKVNKKDFTKKDIARLTLEVVKCYIEKKDFTCKNILKNASYELFLHINAVANKLNMNNFVIIESGSIFKIPYLKKNFEKYVLTKYDEATFYIPTTPTYYGGYYLAKNIISHTSS